MFLRIIVTLYLSTILLFPSQEMPLSVKEDEQCSNKSNCNKTNVKLEKRQIIIISKGKSIENSTEFEQSAETQKRNKLRERHKRNNKKEEKIPGMGEYGKYWQGDIKKPPVGINSRGFVLNISAFKSVWPQKTVYYTFSSQIPKAQEKTIKAAMNDISRSTCLKFAATTRTYDRILITNNETGCSSSSVGFNKGKGQHVNLENDRYCGRGIAAHELLHAVGFFHTMSRLDRDRYITVHTNNIVEDMRYNYEIVWPDYQQESFGAYFDLESIMMYTPYNVLSLRDKKTNKWLKQYDVKFPYSPYFLKDVNVPGQRDYLSAMDKYLIQRLFDCCKIAWNYNSTAKYFRNGNRKKRFSNSFRAKRFARNISVQAKQKGAKIHAQLPMLVAISICQQNVDFQRTKNIQLPLDRYYNEVPDNLNEYLRMRVVWNKTCTHPRDCARFRVQTFELSRDLTMSRQSNAPQDPGEFGKWFQGDLLDDPQKPNTRAGVANVRLWPQGFVYIIFDDDVTIREEEIIEDAIKEIELKSCVRFVFRNPFPFSQGVVITTHEKGCYSQSVGMSSAKNLHKMNLNSKACIPFRGKIIHQLLHILGLHHEHAKPGGAYTEILLRNIKSDRRDNFRAVATESKKTWGFPVDFGSVMMYPSNAFATSAYLQTILPKDSRFREEDLKKMGQREGMSQQDMAKLNLLYDCCGKLGQ